jgi:hypothetical protein
MQGRFYFAQLFFSFIKVVFIEWQGTKAEAQEEELEWLTNYWMI